MLVRQFFCDNDSSGGRDDNYIHFDDDDEYDGDDEDGDNDDNDYDDDEKEKDDYIDDNFYLTPSSSCYKAEEKSGGVTLTQNHNILCSVLEV